MVWPRKKRNFFFFAPVHIQVQKRQWHPTSVLLPGKSHGQRSLVGCSPWGREESDMTERLNFHFSLSRIGEGNGNPLQCSCLENPRDGGAWWAAVYGVAQSRTRLKRLSSSSIFRLFVDFLLGCTFSFQKDREYILNKVYLYSNSMLALEIIYFPVQVQCELHFILLHFFTKRTYFIVFFSTLWMWMMFCF